MSGPSQVEETALDADPRVARDALIGYLADGTRPRSDWKIGTEHEKFGFLTDTLRPPTFDGARGIEAILEDLQQYGWAPVREALPGAEPRTIALTRDNASVSLEPAGQLELSGAPLASLHETCKEAATHLKELRSVAEPRGVGFLGMGFQPKWRRDEMPWMPKGRYAIMQRYMPQVGTLGLDMMTRTCTVQVNLDVGSEADMVKKFRVSLALQSVATALFADSPFTEGTPNGFKSYRSHIWTDTDADRTGLLDFVFEDGFGYERYVDYLLDVPMYFTYRDGLYIDAAGQSFRDFMAARLPALPGALPTMKDWADHMTTAFPEVRLKRYLEMRGADSGPWNRICALSAFWVGLLYDDTALDAAWDLVRDFSLAERHALRDGVPRHGFALAFRSGTVRDLARRALEISAHGLARRDVRNSDGRDETGFLDPLMEFVEANQTPADRKLELFHGRWNGTVDPVFNEFAY